MATDKQQSREKREGLAEERTDWALHRTALAKERTFSAWLRTGLAAVAAGVGVARLLTIENVQYLTKIIGTVFVFAGGILFAVAFWRYRHGYRELREELMKVFPLPVAAIVVVLLLIGAAVSMLVIYIP